MSLIEGFESGSSQGTALLVGSVIFFAGSGTLYLDPDEIFSSQNIGKKFHNSLEKFS
jgi:hypothetical protein